jgi:hypothetical protein
MSNVRVIVSIPAPAPAPVRRALQALRVLIPVVDVRVDPPNPNMPVCPPANEGSKPRWESR